MSTFNKRVFYACEAVFLQPIKADGTTVGNYECPLGVQSIGMTTNFNLEKIFTLGQLAQYDSIENNPELQVTLNKVFDGTKPLFLIAAGGGDNAGNLITFANNRVNLRFGIYRDTTELTTSASGVSYMEATGMYLQSVNFTFPTDGNATEEVTLVGNNKKWYMQSAGDGIATQKSAPGIVRRWKFSLADCILPIGDGGMKKEVGGPNPPLNSVKISADLKREPTYTLGSYEPYTRSITFPVEVNTEIESLATVGDFIDTSELNYAGCTGSNTNNNQLKNFQIKFVICGDQAGDKLVLDLGLKNKLNSVSYGGGEAGGGNLTLTYSFTTDNYLRVEAYGSYTNVNGKEASQTVGNAP